MKNRFSHKKKQYKFKVSDDGGIFAGIIVIILTIAVILTGSFLYYKTYSEINNIGNDYCRKDKISAITVILIDHTDKLNTMQRASLEGRLWDDVSSIPKNSLLEVYSVGNTTEHPLVPVLNICNPGDENSVNNLTGNKLFAEKNYEEKFKKPIRDILGKIVNDQSDIESPIMESLQSISVTSFIGEQNKNAEKKLIIVSDLLQHSKSFSVYKGIPDFNTFKDTPYWRSIKADFKDVDVEIYVLNRSNAIALQNPRLLKLWTDYFENQYTTVKNVIPVEG